VPKKPPNEAGGTGPDPPGPPNLDDGAFWLSEEWLTEVATTPENDLRAHRVALTYSKLAACLDDRIHGEESMQSVLRRRRHVGACNANWFHFATWGTVTITRNIASERPPQRIDTLPLAMLRRWLTPAVIRLRASSGQRVSRALSWGQRLIFVSVCFSFAELVQWLEEDPDGDPRGFELTRERKGQIARAKQIMELGSWDEQPWIARDRHLEAITEAFRFYIHARRTEDPRVSARCMLGGNVLLTAVEQDLVDSAVKLVVDHIPQTAAAALDQRAARLVERWTDVPRQVTSLQLPYRYPHARAALDAAWSRLMTDQVLVMTLPTETLRLGRDIPPRWPGQPYFPPDLLHLRARPDGVDEESPDAEVLDRVADLIASFDRTTGDGRDSAARDWRRWDERMNWAATLMRSRQHDESVFWAPYSREDAQSIVAGRLPRRAGDPSQYEVQPPMDEPAEPAGTGSG
jgi:hypothetical protein